MLDDLRFVLTEFREDILGYRNLGSLVTQPITFEPKVDLVFAQMMQKFVKDHISPSTNTVPASTGTSAS